MTVIAFRRRSSGGEGEQGGDYPRVDGSFRSPRGRSGWMRGLLRVRRFVLTTNGLCLSGVFTAELREDDGSLIGVDSRRATVPVEVVHDEKGSHLVVAAVDLDLMGLTVHTNSFTMEPPPRALRDWRPGSGRRSDRHRGDPPC